MRLLDGASWRTAEAAELRDRCATASRVVVDVGTGDGRHPWRVARAQPTWLVVGIDPARERMVDTARRAARRPDRGGAPNLALVWAAVEDEDLAPLAGVAHELTVLAPWGGLLRGVAAPEPGTLVALRRLARSDAGLVVTMGTRLWSPPVPDALHGLPAPAPDGHLDGDAVATWRAAGWGDPEVAVVAAADLGDLASSWSRRLADRPDERFLVVRARAVAPA